VDARTLEDNPSCGDRISVELEIQDSKVVDASFNAVGCALSIASASMHIQRVLGMTLKEVLELTKDDAVSLVQIQVSPVRLRCVLIPLEAIQKAVCEYIKNNTKNG
jgi:nitrogen fixation NifU-like protein